MGSFEPWTFRPGAGYSDRSRLDGYKVLATDGEVGKVEDASYPPGQAALVVDTGPWIVGQRILLPAGVVTYINHHDKEITVDHLAAEIKEAPPYEPDGGQDPSYRDRLADYYRALQHERQT
jgi:hypothetical protein